MNAVDDLLKYAILLCNNNELQTAGYYAAAVFELLLPKVKVDGNKVYEPRIDAYCRTNNCSRELYNLLLKCRDVRNQIVHQNSLRSVQGLIDDLCIVRGVNKHQLANDLDHEDYRRFRKKFSTSGSQIHPTTLVQLFSGFNQQDFRSLNEMRNTLSYLREKLAPWCERLNPPIYFDEISEATSAYVWLAAVRTLESERPKIDQPSISVLATNYDIRVYLDFGGRCKNERKRYYHLLLNKVLDPLLKTLGPDFRIFDTYWYFNLENIMTIQQFAERREHGDIADENILARVAEFEEQLDGKRTISENKLLIGRIFSKDEIINAGIGFAHQVESVIGKLHPIICRL